MWEEKKKTKHTNTKMVKQISTAKNGNDLGPFYPTSGHFFQWARKEGANHWVFRKKKQFHIDNATMVKLHLAFADKSTHVTEEFSTPRAICAVHWTSESQQASRRS